MVIERSAAGEVTRLVGQLKDHKRAGREAAVARLIILGARAVARLLETLEADPHPGVRAAILRTLEAIGDRRGLEPAIRRLEAGGPDVAEAVAAVGVVRVHLDGARPDDADRAFEALTAVALDRSRPERVRLAALDALEDLPHSTRQAIFDTLAGDPNPRVKSRSVPGGPVGRDRSREALDEAAAGVLPDAPDHLRGLVAAHGATATLSTLYRLVRAVRDREAEEEGGTRAAWQAVRAKVHHTLAARHSRVALYDLRESVAEAREPLPDGFLDAMSTIGDASCLEPIAAAFGNSTAVEHEQWRATLAASFQGIVRRKRLSRRHPAVRRVLTRWPQVASTLLGPRR